MAMHDSVLCNEEIKTVDIKIESEFSCDTMMLLLRDDGAVVAIVRTARC